MLGLKVNRVKEANKYTDSDVNCGFKNICENKIKLLHSRSGNAFQGSECQKEVYWVGLGVLPNICRSNWWLESVYREWPSCQIRKIAGCACAGNAGNVFSPRLGSCPDMHHGTGVTHIPWCMSELLTSGFLWSRWRGKRSRHSRRMRNPQFCVSGMRPILSKVTNTGTGSTKLIVAMLVSHQEEGFERATHSCVYQKSIYYGRHGSPMWTLLDIDFICIYYYVI